MPQPEPEIHVGGLTLTWEATGKIVVQRAGTYVGARGGEFPYGATCAEGPGAKDVWSCKVLLANRCELTGANGVITRKE